MKVLVTGSTGFVGRHLCTHLLEQGWEIRGTLLPQEQSDALNFSVVPVMVEPLGEQTLWSHALDGIDTVIHLAARVHVMDDPEADPLAVFREVNVAGTERLAREAVRAGVRRLIFVSSIKVNGEESEIPYTEASPVRPTDSYGISKWEAEQALRRIEAETGLQVVVVRPTLVYGPGVKANFLNMIKVVQRGIPLPFASIHNRRSLIYVGNLVDALSLCARHPGAAGQTYLVSDGEDVSTPELIRRTAAALVQPAHLFSFPSGLLRFAGRLTARSTAVERLVGSLAVDSSKIHRELAWTPPFTMDQGLAETAKWFLSK